MNKLTDVVDTNLAAITLAATAKADGIGLPDPVEMIRLYKGFDPFELMLCVADLAHTVAGLLATISAMTGESPDEIRQRFALTMLDRAS